MAFPPGLEVTIDPPVLQPRKNAAKLTTKNFILKGKENPKLFITLITHRLQLRTNQLQARKHNFHIVAD